LDNYSIVINGPSLSTLTGIVSEPGFSCFDDPACSASAVANLSSSFLEFSSYKKYTPAAMALLPGNYSITLAVYDDALDAAFDSGLLIDSISITGNSAIPEPGTMWLAAAGLVILLWWRR
jgi:hypothetical protein